MITKSNLTVNHYSERAQAIREIEAECARAEQDKNVDLEPLKRKISDLTAKFNEDALGMNIGRNGNDPFRHRYDLQVKELSVLRDRVHALSQEGDSPEWVELAFYTACAVAAIAPLLWLGTNLYPTPTPTFTPTPTPTFQWTPTPTPTPPTFQWTPTPTPTPPTFQWAPTPT